MNRSERKITIIPPTKANALLGSYERQLRVAAYCRVSTDSDEQLGSFETQKAYYADLIMRNPKWNMAGIYADEGISGGKADNRPDFQRMVRHCKNGKIDMIITKSISRFSRNTVDALEYVRKLKLMGIPVIFEKENLNTMEQNTEMVFTMLSSMSQQELESLSKNVKRGKDMKAQSGDISPMLERLYGYRKVQKNQYEIIEEQGDVVRKIFRQYLIGLADSEIARELNDSGIESKSKSKVWSASAVQSILTNEKYCGDIVYPKTIILDPISKKIVKNNGEYMQVLISDNHEGIVTHEIFHRAQEERARRSSKRKVSDKTITEQGKYSSKYALTDILICGYCGTAYRRVTWPTGKGTHKAVWRCISRLDHGKRYCTDSVTLEENQIHETIVNALKACTADKQKLIPILSTHIEQALWKVSGGEVNIEELEQQMEQLKKATMELMMECTLSNTVAENEDKLRALNDEARELNEQIRQYKANDSTKTTIGGKLKDYTDFLQIDHSTMERYDDSIVRQLIHTIKVYEDKIHLYFKDGSEWQEPLVPKRKMK